MLKNLMTYRASYTNLTVADILRDYWSAYCQRYRVTPEQARVAGAVMALRQAQDAPAERQPWGVG